MYKNLLCFFFICDFLDKITGKIDLVFGVPSTTRLGSNGFNRFKEFVKEVSSSYSLSANDTNVGVIQYGGNARVVLPLSEGNSKDVLEQRLDRMTFRRGSQNVPNALQLASSEMFGPGGSGRVSSSKYFVFGAEGSTSESKEDLELAARGLNYEGVSIMPIPIGAGSSRSNLKAIASTPKRNFFLPARNVNSLGASFQRSVVSSVRPGM